MPPLQGQQLRTYIISDLGFSIRTGRSEDYNHVIESAGAYIASRCFPKTMIDSIRTAYIYAHLAFAFDAVESSKDVVKTFEQGRYFMGLLPDTLQLRLLRGVAWAMVKEKRWNEAEELALRSTRIAHNRGFDQAKEESWLCYLGVLEAREEARGQRQQLMIYWLLPWLLIGFLLGSVTALIMTLKKKVVALSLRQYQSHEENRF